MLISRWSSITKQAFIIEVFGDKDWKYFWEMRFLPRWLPLFLGLSLGLILASWIAEGRWHYVVPLVLAVPAIIIFNRDPFIAVILWALLTPFFVNTPTAAERFIYWILHRAMIPTALLIVIFSGWLGTSRRKSIHLGRAELAMLFFLILAVVNIFLFTNNLQRRLINFYDLIFVPFCIYWLIRLLAPTEEDLKKLLWVALIVVLAQSTVGLLSWFAPALVPYQWQSGLEGERTVGTLRNVAVYTSTLLLFALLLLQYGLQCRSRWLRVGILLLFGWALFCVFLSFSRASWGGEIIVLLALLLLYPRIMIRFTIILTIVSYLLIGTVLADEIAFAYERLTGETALRSAEGRVITNNASIEMIKRRPFFGWGFRNYDLYDRRFQTRVGNISVRYDGTSHNTYLTIMAEFGTVGFLFYMFPPVWWLIVSLRSWSKIPRGGFWSRSLLVMLWIVMLHMFIVTSAMDMIRFHEFGTSIWWLTLGLIGNMIHSYFKSEDIRSLNPAYQPVARI